jgi:isopenicillin N synthase-like dioxygenase
MNKYSIVSCRTHKVYIIEHDRDVEEIGGSQGYETIYIMEKIHNPVAENYLRNVELPMSEFHYECNKNKGENPLSLVNARNTISPIMNFKKFGYHVIELNGYQVQCINNMYNMFYEFCKMPDESKDSYSYASLKNTQPQFGYRKTELRKEYFVCRKIPFSLVNKLQYPSQEFENIVYQTFDMYSSVAKDLLVKILKDLQINHEKIEEILVNIVSPAQSVDVFGFSCMMEVFRYDCEGAPQTYRVPCGDHTDASLLTFIPKCMGPSGLDVFNWNTGGWERIEEQTSANQCIVLAGELLHRLTAGMITPTSHRVVIEQFPDKEKARFSCPFEIMLNPTYTMRCKDLFPNKEIAKEYEINETSPDYISRVSQNLVSVNK